MTTTFYKIMFFYAFLSCFAGPFIFHYFVPTAAGYERGYILGTVVSMILWFAVGRSMIKS